MIPFGIFLMRSPQPTALERGHLQALADHPPAPGICFQPPPELFLLLACLRADCDPAREHELDEALTWQLDWDYLLRLAESHAVRPLLARHLVEHPAVPDGITELLRQFSVQNTVWNLRLAAELVRLCNELKSRGVQPIVYKGPVLSEYLYGDIALREIYDLDILVRPDELSEAVRCLDELHFEDYFGLSPSQRRVALRNGFEHSFVRDGIVIDLHWRLGPEVNWPASHLDKLWQNLAPFTFCKQEVQIFRPEAMLAVLCMHAAQHDWADLKMFAEIAVLLRREADLDFTMAEDFAANSHARRGMDVALQLTHARFQAKLPEPTLDRIERDPQTAAIADAVFRGWAVEQRTRPETDIRWLLFTTRGEDAITRWRNLAWLVFPPKIVDLKSFDLPPALAWLYWLWRPLRLIWKRIIRRNRGTGITSRSAAGLTTLRKQCKS